MSQPETGTARLGAAASLAAIAGLNAVPLYGVLALGWQSFDLILLYWIENVIIGCFSVMRFVVRPYRHPLDLVMPLLLAPFFTLHYGMFCSAHGSFVVGLFGDPALRSLSLAEVVLDALQTPFMRWCVGALLVLQLLDWLDDVRVYGLGAEGVKPLMVAPYRRIVVLHLTILLSGFALGALDEPTVGLVILIALKIGFDVHHWRRQAAEGPPAGEHLLSPEDHEELAALYPKPVVTVNDEEFEYESFAAMRDSKHYRLMGSIMRLMGAGAAIGRIDAYMAHRIREERQAAGGDPPPGAG